MGRIVQKKAEISQSPTGVIGVSQAKVSEAPTESQRGRERLRSEEER